MEQKNPLNQLNGGGANQEMANQEEVNQGEAKILRNTSYLSVAFIFQKILSFLYFIVVARSIGPTDLGLYDPIKSLIPISLILIDFSLSAVLTRETARAPEKSKEYLNNILSIKIIFALVVLTFLGLFTNFSNYSDVTKSILYLAGLVVALDTFTLSFFAVFRGVQNMKYEAIGVITTQVLTMIIGVTALKLGYGLRALFLATLSGSVFNVLFSLIMMKRKLGFFPSFRWDKTIIKTFLKIAIPFAIAAIFVKIYTYTDRFMLLSIAGQKFVGWYITAHKLTYALEFIPSAFAAAIFPAMSAYYVYSKEKLAKTFEKTMFYLMILAIPISLGVIVLADKIILKIYGPVFTPSIIPLRILISGLIVIFLNFPIGAFLNACNRQVINTINMGIIVVVNVVLNLLLIKQYTFKGAAIAALVSGILLFFLGLRWVGKIIKYDKKFLLKTLAKSVFASGLMALSLFIIKNKVDIYIHLDSSPLAKNISALLSISVYIGIGALIYLIILFLIKGFRIEDFKFLYLKIFKKRL